MGCSPPPSMKVLPVYQFPITYSPVSLCMANSDFGRKIFRVVAGLTALGVAAIACQQPVRGQLSTEESATTEGLKYSRNNSIYYKRDNRECFSPADRLAKTACALYAQNVRPELAHKLGSGDRILVEIVEVPELSGEYEVLSDGSITLRLVGSLFVKGMTLPEAAQAITDKYAPTLKDPVVSVILAAIRPLNVGVAGEVTRPGNYAINLISGVGVRPGVQYPTAMQAIEKAGGVTQSADIRQVKLRRPQRSGPDVIININLWEILQTGDFSQDVTLQDGDSIFIPTTTNVNLPEVRQIASASFAQSAEQPRMVNIVGEVNSPGSYVLVGGNTGNEQRTLGFPTVTRAIQKAGGITSLADIRRILVRRTTKGGGEQIISVNLWQLLQTGDFTQDALLQDGDTIFVPRTTVANPAETDRVATANFAQTMKVYVLGELRLSNGPLVEVPINTTLNQALMVHGGFGYENVRGKRSSVDLVRMNGDGTVTKRTIKLDLTQGINEQTNPLLQNNDIIVVDTTELTRLTDRVGEAIGPVGAVYPMLRVLETLNGLIRIFR